jgi:hypothetical protein
MKRLLIILISAIAISGCTINGFDQKEKLTIISVKDGGRSGYKYEYEVKRDGVFNLYFYTDSTYQIGDPIKFSNK